MDARPSALRKALYGGHHSGMDRLRRSSEANASISGACPQQRRGSPAEESRKLGSMPATTATHSWEFHEPAQPRGSSPVSRPPSVRQRQGGLSAFPPKGWSASGSGSASYESGRFEPAASSAAESSATGSLGTPRGSAPGQGHRKGAADREMVGGSGADRRGEAAPTRSSMRAAGAGSGKVATDGRYSRKATAAAESSSSILRRGSTSSNQAEDPVPSDATPRRLPSSSARAVSCPSGSQYLEPGFQHGDAVVPHRRHGSRGGQTNRRGDHEDENEDSSRRSSGSRIGGGGGGGGGGHRDGYRHHDGGRSGGAGLGARGSVRASPSMASSTSASTEGERCLPSIDGLEISNNPAEDKPEGGRQGGGEGSGGRGDPGCTPSSARHGRDLDPPGGSSHGGGAHAEGRSRIGEGLLPGKETGGQFSNNRNEDDDDRDNTGSHRRGRNNNSDRDEPGDKEHAYVGASRSSGGSRVDPSGHVSGGRVVPGGNGNNSGGDVVTSRRRASGSLQSDSEAAGRAARNSSSSSSSRSGNRDCLVGLQNLGNTCFMNACLQCLLHTDALVDLFRGRHGHREQRLRSHSTTSPTHGALAQAFGELVAMVEASPAHSNVSPAQVKRLIGSGFRVWQGVAAEIAEFLRFFLDGMAEDLNTRGGGGSGGQNHHGHQRGATTSPQQQPHVEGGAGASGCHHQQQQRSGPPPPPPAINQELTDEQISRLTAEQQADRAWAQHRARNNSDITGMFCGQLQSRISCLTCGNVSFCFDPFFDLSVPLPSGSGRAGAAGERGGDEGGGYGGRNSRGSHSSGGRGGESSSAFGGTSATTTTTLEDCLRAFSTEETLDGDNRPVCTRCRKRRSSSKGLAVHRFPPILVIHLKRFQYSSTSRTKLATAVDFPIGSELDLFPYSTPAARPSSSGSSGGGANNSSHTRSTSRGSAGGGGGGGNSGQRPPLYELYAVCNHMGGLHGGHYTAHCRSRSRDGGNGGVTAGEWHTFDDTRVSPVSTSRVGGAAAYVLFYRLLESQHAR
ncbi:unnamed protein product [Ectocarpus sp. CCAP 1310/34]|nr:unnamed protein product [Ectocarpus sp. CCAP 1310/34]